MPNFVTFPGSHRDLSPHSRAAGAVDLAQATRITLNVRSKGDLAELEARAKTIAATPLAQRKYLSHTDLERFYGASAGDLDKIEAYARKHDLRVVHRSALARSITLAGTLGTILAAFPADVRLYHSPMGTYRGRTGHISLPEELIEIVTGIFGFDTRPKQRAPFRARALARQNAGPGAGQGVAATEFATRYKFPAKSGSKTLNGAGQTIAIIELGGGYRHADLVAFFHEIGQPIPVTSAIGVDHSRNAPSDAQSADGEVMLDIEVAGAVVPMARFAVYFGPNEGDKGFLDTISAAIHDTQRKPGVISISWGSSESLSDKQGIDAYHQLFVAAAALGITICVASGDHGTANTTADAWDGGIHVDHPSCDPMVLSCGGTQIDNGVDVVWNDSTTLTNGGWAGGGGVSVVYPLPDYQANANVPVSLVSGNPGRGVPDIAMSATDYFTRVDSYEGPSGGTSAVAPLMAALVAKLNQAKGKNVGYLNPFLYAHPGAFTDVTSGTNALNGGPNGYAAKAGWDAATGLGTPDGDALLALL
jgi:kumamolisin